MAGIYIHIPFCSQKCYYCDFYSVRTNKTQHDYDKNLISAFKKEIREKSIYLEGENIETIYFGGGTPSLLSEKEINEIIDCISENHPLNKDAEITIEVNPDDLGRDYIKAIRNVGINRISIGIQSFNDNILKFLNRRHNAIQARDSVLLCQEAGIENISADIIFGIPGMTAEDWKNTINETINIHVPHVSAYILSYEDGTPLMKMVEQSKIKKESEKNVLAQFSLLMDKMEENNFAHYEISNYAREGFYSIHNSNYWKQKKYTGIGPSAHSYNTVERRWNVADINLYINAITNGKVYYEKEVLDNRARYNEYMLTSLRTEWGIDLNTIKADFSNEYVVHFELTAEKYLNQNLLNKHNNIYTLSREGKFIADYIIREFIRIE